VGRPEKAAPEVPKKSAKQVKTAVKEKPQSAEQFVPISVVVPKEEYARKEPVPFTVSKKRGTLADKQRIRVEVRPYSGLSGGPMPASVRGEMDDKSPFKGEVTGLNTLSVGYYYIVAWVVQEDGRETFPDAAMIYLRS